MEKTSKTQKSIDTQNPDEDWYSEIPLGGRRASPRVLIDSFCPARLSGTERDLVVYVVNVSKYGVQLECEETPNKIQLKDGVLLTLWIETPLGPCRWEGEVKWVKQRKDKLRMGMKFGPTFARPSNPLAVMWRVAMQKIRQQTDDTLPKPIF